MMKTPTQIEPFSPTEILVNWNTGESYALPYAEVRFYCPCASCIDEHTGQRTIEKTSIPPDIRPNNVQLVGKYAVQIDWSDGHNTGMYHFDRLFELCQKQGKRLP
jgi:DUF971 family protein